MSRTLVRIQTLLVAVIAVAGCHDDMYNQPRYEPLEPSSFFADGRSSRPLVPGTISRDAIPSDSVLATGRENGQLVTDLPVELNEKLLQRGQERFNIFCSVCHGRTGEGNGMIVQRGFTKPPTFHSQRLRGVPIGHFFDVMTSGFGRMPAYAAQVPIKDRWAIAAYIRALQLSQYADVTELPTEEPRTR